MNSLRLIVYLILASLLGAIDWGIFLFRLFMKVQSFLFDNPCILFRKCLRLLHASGIREIRRMEQTKQIKPALKSVPVFKTDAFQVVGGSKTVFITELPVLHKPEPVEAIELTFENPEDPEEMQTPDADEFEAEQDTIPEDEKRRLLEESLYNDPYDENTDDTDLGGVSIPEMEQAYRILHKEISAEEKDKVVVNVLNCLNNTDMFKMLIHTEESDLMAKSIMDRYIEKNSPQSRDNTFDIGYFLE